MLTYIVIVFQWVITLCQILLITYDLGQTVDPAKCGGAGRSMETHREEAEAEAVKQKKLRMSRSHEMERCQQG